MLCVSDTRGRILLVNPAWERALGWTPDELCGRPYLDFVHPDDIAPTQAAAEALSRGETVIRFTNRYRMKQGGWRDLEWSSAVDPGDGLVYATVRDITDDKRAAAHAARIEAVSGVGSWEVDLDTKALFWSSVTYAIHEMDPAETPCVEDAVRFYPPEARALLEPALARLLGEGEPYDLELPFDTARGRRRVVRTTGAVEHRAGRMVRTYGTFQDVTKSKRAERRLSDIIEGARAGTWEWNVQTGETIFNARWAEIVGWSLDEISPTTIETWARFVHPDDLAVSKAALEAHFAGETDSYRCEARMRHRDGRWVWVLDLGRVVSRTAEGAPEWVSGTHIDITETKEQALALTQAHNRLKATLEAIPDLLFELDADGRYVGFHTGKSALLAKPPEQFLGKMHEEIMPSEIAAVGRAAMFEVDRTGRSSGRQYRIDLPAGPRWFELSAASRAPDQPHDRPGYVFLSRDVTQRKQAQEALRYREALLKGLFELAPIGIVLNDLESAETLDVNDAMLAMVGCSREAFLALTYREFTPEDQSPIDERIAKALREQGRFGPLEKHLLRKGGARFPAMLRGARIEDSEGRVLVWTMIEDISERRGLLDALQGERDFLDAIMNTSVSGIAALDAQGFIVFVNEEAGRLLGVRPAGMGPRWFDDPGWRIATLEGGLITPGDLPFARVMETGVPVRDMRLAIHKSDGERRILSINAAPVSADGAAARVVCAFTDVTEQVEALEALEAARRAAEEASRAKSRFLATMSHEIRTPMNGVLGMAGVLDAALSEPEHRRMLGVIRESGALLLGLLNDILDFSKIEAGRITLEAAPFAPDDLGRRIEAAHGVAAMRKGLSFELRLDDGAAAARLGDAHRIEQILHNLVGNAIKFTEAGGVGVSIGGSPGAPLDIEVRDTGIGMTEEQIARIFEDFAQADSSTTRRFGGTGLGMSIVKGLVDAMGGEIAVESRPGAGARIRIALPLPGAGMADAPARAAPSSPAPPERLNARVLAADDNEINRIVLEAMLARLGVETVMVEDGAQAVAAFVEASGASSEEHVFDLALLDISMPVMDGATALAAIRAHEAAHGLPRIPAIAVTAHALQPQIEASFAAGFDEHLPKPLDPQTLEEAMRKALARSARAS